MKKARLRARRVITIYDPMLCEGMQGAVTQMTGTGRGAITLAACALLLAACGGPKDAAPQGAALPTEAEEAGYLTPPSVTTVKAGAGGALIVTGRTQPGALVRLVPSPAGEVATLQADPTGAWRLVIPMSGGVRLYAISAEAGGRAVQAQGYLLLTPDGQAAELRSGAGARVVARASDTPRILSVDYDRDGAAVVSGVAKPGAGLAVRIDRTPGGDVKTGADGRFTFPLSAPLHPGGHLIDVAGEGGIDAVSASTGSPTGGGGYSGARSPQGWRIDWTTPGGGAQTTLLLARPGAGG
ncbi:MAG: hypothetical protein JWP35_3884 [Caulobacter sp.]|nr:hypothetical protein [Caulobacter sp.]